PCRREPHRPARGKQPRLHRVLRLQRHELVRDPQDRHRNPSRARVGRQPRLGQRQRCRHPQPLRPKPRRAYGDLHPPPRHRTPPAPPSEAGSAHTRPSRNQLTREDPMSTPQPTARVTATVTLDVHPRPGQTPTQAAANMAATFRHYLQRHDFPFWEDYGVALEDIQDARDNGEHPSWGGYDGPFVTSVHVNATAEPLPHTPSDSMARVHLNEFREAAATAREAAQRHTNDDEIEALQNAVRSAAHALNTPDPF